jgi:hypothetical protein
VRSPVNEPGRAVPFMRTKAGKQLVAQLIVTVGVVANLVGIFLQTNPRVDPGLLRGLTGFGLGMVLVGGIALVSIRKNLR